MKSSQYLGQERLMATFAGYSVAGDFAKVSLFCRAANQHDMWSTVADAASLVLGLFDCNLPAS